MPAMRILADDLSGALDAAVCFAGGPDSLLVSRSLPSAQTFACSSAARDLGTADAGRAFAERLTWLLAARLPFHKVDSRLRGHVAHEIAAIRQAAPDRPIVIAPALPSQGRAVRAGRVWSRQPDTADWDCEPANVARDLAGMGHPVAICRPGTPLAEGISLWDAETDSDLDRVIAAAAAQPNAILCGSSGLATAVARSRSIPSPPVQRHQPPPLLLIAGTVHPRTLSQIAALETAYPGIRHVFRGDGSDLAAISAALKAGESCLLTADIPESCPRDAIQRRTEAMLQSVAASPERPGSLFVTGGETLDTLAGALEAHGFVLTGQAADGVPVSRFVGGRWDGLEVVSKSGGFGAADLLVGLVPRQV